MYGSYPDTRLRRLRQAPWLRELVQETRLHPSDFIWPVFVVEGEKQRIPVDSLPGVERYSIDVLCDEVKKAYDLGIRAVALFPVVPAEKKTELAEEAYHPENLMNRTIAELKHAVPEMGVIGDVALDPYTSHGQDGIVEHGVVVNDPTVEVLCQQAVSLAKTGCDIVAPSDMMDGRVGAIRHALDAVGKQETCILSYAAKYASAFYGPFRDAVGSASNLGAADKKSYQMNPANAQEALREVALDIEEGADMVMVKPALAYLDVIADIKAAYHVPTFAYHVSGEYAAVKAAGANGWIDAEACMLEALMGIKRAGADAIVTYAAREVVPLL